MAEQSVMCIFALNVLLGIMKMISFCIAGTSNGLKLHKDNFALLSSPILLLLP